MLVHGIGMSHRSFRRLQTVLARARTTVAVDLPGFGGAPDPGRPLRADALARAVIAAVLEAHPSAHSLVVVGQSMGAQVAVEAGLLPGAPVAAVVVIGPVVDDRRATAVAQAGALLLDVGVESARMNAVVITDSLRSARQYRRQLEPMLRYPMLERVAMLDRPLVVVRGSADRISDATWARRIVRAAPNGRLVELPGPHHVQESDPVGVAALVGAALPADRDAPSSGSAGSAGPADGGGTPERRRPGRVTIARWWVLDWTASIVGQARSLGRTSPADYADGSRRPVVVLPGIYETWHFLEPLMVALHDAGHPVFVVPALGHNVLPIPESAAILRSVIEREDLRDVLILAHSKGGLIGKYAMTLADPQGRIGGMIAIGTPFAGSRWARVAPVTHLRSLHGADPVISALRLDAAVNARITSIFGVFDTLVPSGSRLVGARNVELPVGGHFRILRDPRAVVAVLAAADAACE